MLATDSNHYLQLLQQFPPRPIKSEEELSATQAVIDDLIDSGNLGPDEQDYINVLGSLVYEYEQEHVAIPDLYGVDLLEALIAELGLRQKDLVGIFKTESIVSSILNRKRKFTVEHIEKLADFFNVSTSAFFPSTSLKS